MFSDNLPTPIGSPNNSKKNENVELLINSGGYDSKKGGRNLKGSGFLNSDSQSSLSSDNDSDNETASFDSENHEKNIEEMTLDSDYDTNLDSSSDSDFVDDFFPENITKSTDISKSHYSCRQNYIVPLDRLESILKKTSRYLQIETHHCLFRDAIQFESAGMNLDRFMQSWSLPKNSYEIYSDSLKRIPHKPPFQTKKSFFPYQYLDHLKKLDLPNLPPQKWFIASMSTCETITDTEYLECQNIYKERKMTHFFDWLRFYNCADTTPFFYGIKLKSFQHTKDCFETPTQSSNVSLYKDFITLPSYAINYALLCKQRDYEYYYPPEIIQPTLQNSITGGLALSIRRYHNNMTNPLCQPQNFFKQTYIRNNKNFPFKKLLCVDANSLYLGSFSHLSPIGPAYLRKQPDFQPIITQKEFTQTSLPALEWCLYLEQLNMPNLQFFGSGKSQNEPKILGRFVDAFDPISNTVFLFNGCFWHSCIKCYPQTNNLDPHPLRKPLTHSQIRQMDQQFRMDLIRAGYLVKIISECRWTLSKKNQFRCQNIHGKLQRYKNRQKQVRHSRRW